MSYVELEPRGRVRGKINIGDLFKTCNGKVVEVTRIREPDIYERQRDEGLILEYEVKFIKRTKGAVQRVGHRYETKLRFFKSNVWGRVEKMKWAKTMSLDQICDEIENIVQKVCRQDERPCNGHACTYARLCFIIGFNEASGKRLLHIPERDVDVESCGTCPMFNEFHRDFGRERYCRITGGRLTGNIKTIDVSCPLAKEETK